MGKGGAKIAIPRAEQLRIVQRVHAKWSEIYDDRDDVEANDAYFKMYEEAMDGHLTQQWETAILQMLKKKGADLSNEKIAGKFDGFSEAWTKATFPVDSIKELMRLTDEFEEGLGKGRNAV